MSQDDGKIYDLEDRTLLFAKNVRRMARQIPKTILTRNDVTQVMRSSGSIGANYIEANAALGKKDFQMRLRIARKEAKETVFWLNLLNDGCDENVQSIIMALIQEADELMKILGAILRKSGQTEKSF